MKWLDEPRGRPAPGGDTNRPAPHRARKNRRRWCRGKTGVEHIVDTRISKWGQVAARRWPDRKPCFRAEWSSHYWVCQHERFCSTCGKILVSGFGKECPDYTPAVTRHRPPGPSASSWGGIA